MSQLIETEAFVIVVQEGSFAAAGKRLDISSSYVSKLITRLEDRLGVRLLQRTTRKLTLTDAGSAYHELCSEGLGLIAQAEEDAAHLQHRPRGRLRVTFPTTLGLSWLASWIADFSLSNPELSLDVVYLDRSVDLVAEGFDVAVRAGALADSSLIARKLAVARRVLVASPAYIERAGAPEQPQALREHTCLIYSNSQHRGRWQLRNAGEDISIDVTGPMIANSGQALLQAACRGLGIAYLPHFHVAEAIASGHVVPLLPAWSSEAPIHAIYPSARHLPAKIRLFIDSLAAYLEHPPWDQLGQPSTN